MFMDEPLDESYRYFASDDDAADEQSDEQDDRGSDPEPVQR
jgi:hypothetical protein